LPYTDDSLQVDVHLVLETVSKDLIMRRRFWTPRSGRVSLAVVLAGFSGVVVGALLATSARPNSALAQDHKAAPAGVKAPIAEVLHCPLAFAGVHLLKDLPEHLQVAYHYCKPLSDDVAQCLLYDSTGPHARLIGVEYLVSDAIYGKMPAAEKAFWHDHKYEVDTGLLKSLTQTGDDEKKTLAAVRPLWGKVFHTWTTGKTYPSGPPRLFWSVTGEEPFVLPADFKLPAS
jgi:hypothetical protein